MRDYYKDLGVSPDANTEDIKRRYRNLALKLHPDRGGDSDKFALVNRAYEVLSDGLARGVYDNSRREIEELSVVFGISALINVGGAVVLGTYGVWAFARTVCAKIWGPRQ